MVPKFYSENFSRQFRPWKKECTESTRLLTKIKSFKNGFLNMKNFINPKQVYADLRSDFCAHQCAGRAVYFAITKYGKAKRPPGVADMCQRIRGLDAP